MEKKSEKLDLAWPRDGEVVHEDARSLTALQSADNREAGNSGNPGPVSLGEPVEDGLTLGAHGQTLTYQDGEGWVVQTGGAPLCDDLRDILCHRLAALDRRGLLPPLFAAQDSVAETRPLFDGTGANSYT